MLQVSEGPHLVPHLTEFARAPDAATVFEPLEYRRLMFPNFRMGFGSMSGDVFWTCAPLIALWAMIGKSMLPNCFCQGRHIASSGEGLNGRDMEKWRGFCLQGLALLRRERPMCKERGVVWAPGWGRMLGVSIGPRS